MCACVLPRRFAQASNQIRKVSYGIREMQQNSGVPATRVLSTVDTMATRWGNQYRQIERNNMLRPVLEPIIEKWKRENKSRVDAIVEENDDPTRKVPLPNAPPSLPNPHDLSTLMCTYLILCT